METPLWVKDLQSGRRPSHDLIEFVSMLSQEARQRLQLALALAIVVAAVRAGYVLYVRHEENVTAKKEQAAKNAGYANADYYVSPKKLYPYDLKSAKQLTQQPVWVKEGYRYTYYSFDSERRHTDFSHEAGLLLPLERVGVKDVVREVSPRAPNARAGTPGC